MKRGTWGAMLGLAAMLSACGGGGSGGSASSGGTTGTGGSTGSGGSTPVSTATCGLRARQDWAAAQLREWYLFPETLPASLDPAGYTSVDSYIDALTANARAQRKDRYFTYLTSIREEDGYYANGESAGLGFRLSSDTAQRRVMVAEAFEGGPALNAGIDRGAEILAIGTSAANLRTVASLFAAQGEYGIYDALGDDVPGVTRLLRISDRAGVRDISVTKADFALTPVSARYGTQIFDEGGRKVGYVALRTFIETADPALRAAFARFREQGVTELIVDLRYNGGGIISIAELLNDLLGRDRSTGDVQGYTSFRPEKSANDRVRLFRPQPESIAPSRIAFIGTEGTASASELVINAMTPYLRARSALIGTNTYGKPVGQIALDRSECDDRLRVVALAVQNSARSAAYFNGLAGTVEASCAASDDLAVPLGDRREASLARALDFLAGRPCTPISRTSGTITGQSLGGQNLLVPDRPTVAQRTVPGLF